ncbi:DNA-directed RNA polymerase [Pseudomonas laurylsulfatiphila]|uniref:DNA-directed RNA polymerase n=1 Tax=Pseudomonas laurylsulfatiphila TaxID=2011015 RepID=UPI003D202796
MRKSEQLTAESVIPQLFADIMLRDLYSNCTIANKQVIAAAMFKAMFNMEDVVHTTEAFNELYTKCYNYMVSRNRDQGVMLEADGVLEALVLMGFMDELGGVFYVSQKFYDACYVSEKTAPLTSMITDMNRRVSQVKGGKVKPSQLLDKAMRYLEATPFSADMDMATIINLVKSQTPTLDIWKDVKGSMNGINEMEAGVDYYSEQKGDKRARMYHVAHAGTNPQGDDYNRACYKLNVESVVTKDSEAYTYFINELEEAAGKDPKYMATDYLMRVGKSPVRALKTFLESAGVDSPFMYVRLARYFVTFEETGKCDVRVPMGLDAKCSGTQILAILAGNKELLQATGFTNTKVFDPYALCAIQMDMAGIDRNAMKTPYMAIQYGGGVTALVNQKDYMQVMFNAGIENGEEAANITIEAVKRVLGNKIIGLQDYISESIAKIMEETGKTNVVYKHIDGFVVDLQVCGKVELTAAFTSIRYTQSTIISFGSQLKNTGLTVSDKTPSAEEYARTFMVNYIQGIDALVARTVASLCEDAGIEGYVSIHDCFRTALKDTAKLKALICRAYEIIFVENDPIAHLCDQLNIDMPMVSRELTSEMIYNPNAYFFC